MSTHKVNLKQLDLLTNPNLTIDLLVKQVGLYDRNKVAFWKRRRVYKQLCVDMTILVDKLSTIDVSKLTIDSINDCKINYPKECGDMSFLAMMDYQRLITNTQRRDLSDHITTILAICCYHIYSSKPYDRDSSEFIRLKREFETYDAIMCISVYNHMNTSIEVLLEQWQRQFEQYHVDDQDYIAAGGQQMSRHNIIESGKQNAKDFNMTIEQAWQCSYTMCQANSLANAQKAHIQNRMMEIKEARMKREQKQRR